MKYRKWLLAVLLTVLLPGLGHMYAGRLGRGGALYGAGLAAVILIFASQLLHSFPGMVAGCLLLAVFCLFMAFDCARICAAGPCAVKAYNKWYFYALALILGLVVSAVLENTDYLWSKTLRSFRMPSESMANTLLPGDRFYADMAFYEHQEPRAGDLVVLRLPQQESLKYTKRIAAVPGDVVEIEGDSLRVNGRAVDMFSHAPAANRGGQVPARPVRRVLGPDEYFVLGDNAAHSLDSRFFGPVPRRVILGRPLYIYYSTDLSRIGLTLS